MRFTPIAIAAMLAAAPAVAATVYQNGDTDRGGGTSMVDIIQAHDFRLAAAASLTGATFYALDLFGEINGLPLSYTVYASENGLPGSVIAFGTAASFSLTDVGPQGGFGDPEYRISFRFTDAIDVAGAADYWFGVRFGGNAAGIFWSNIPGNGTAIGAELIDGTWYPFVDEASFSLEAAAVPEPANWAMLLTGFGFIGTGLRRRRIPALAN